MLSLLIDNHDSYTFNLFQLIAEVSGAEPVVLTNDDVSLTDLNLDAFDNIVISPGPGRPQVRRDVGYLEGLLRRTALPVLGVCLGHQAIAYFAGAHVTAAPRARHGHLTTVRHEGDPLFFDVPSKFTAVRYHSLRVEEPLPDTLEATAWAEDGVIMALRHRELPRWGVQFHPESIASQYGCQILTNFMTLAGQVRAPVPLKAAPVRPVAPNTGFTIRYGVVRKAVDTQALFDRMFAESEASFWLDSSRFETGLSRFSFIGDDRGPLSETLTYRVGSGAVTVRAGQRLRVETGNIFDVLNSRLAERRIEPAELPFDFVGGYVGYFGYELKSENDDTAQLHTSETPDAMWMFADHIIAVDHEANLTYVLAVVDGRAGIRADADSWIADTVRRLAGLPVQDDRRAQGRPEVSVVLDASDHLIRDHDRYISDIQECQRQLVRGESYEVCITNMLRLPFGGSASDFYRYLRQTNPAPYAALLSFNDTVVLSSSPERFLRITPDGVVNTKPIKGTAARSDDPIEDNRLIRELAGSTKTQAENLMIVDLLRNDLGQVCVVGSVKVERYMAVESYATVHQLVSTIEGKLNPGVSAVDCVRTCFPGGSMTGAPKERTMEIIDGLETTARGIYSGTLGYFGLSGGADLNIVIRTAVLRDGQLSIGAGGAIVLDSDAEEEYQEMLLKTVALVAAYRHSDAVLADAASRLK